MVLVMVRWSITKKETITSWSDCIQVRIGITCLNFQANAKLRDYFRRCHAFQPGNEMCEEVSPIDCPSNSTGRRNNRASWVAAVVAH